MKTGMIAMTVGLLLGAPAWAAKPCEELKSEIEAKLQAKGVQGYSLEIVANADVGDKKVIGSCDGGTKKIIYQR